MYANALNVRRCSLCEQAAAVTAGDGRERGRPLAVCCRGDYP
jgi:hypothetical protein